MLPLGSQNGTVINAVVLRPELFTAAFIPGVLTATAPAVAGIGSASVVTPCRVP